MFTYTKVFLPARPQPDTIIGLYLLSKYGGEDFLHIDKAEIQICKILPEGQTEKSLKEQGILCFDVGGGIFDHHTSSVQTTSSFMVAKHLNILRDDSIQKLLTFAKRDDMYGKGTISKDPIDRAFGFSGLLMTLNKNFPNDPTKVFQTMFPLISSHHEEEIRRCFEMPNELKILKEKDLFVETILNTKEGNSKIAFAETDNSNFAGFLRAQVGGGYDFVVIFSSTGHTNMLTKQSKKIDLRKLVSDIRKKEMENRKIMTGLPQAVMEMPGLMPDVPCWYYDTATNSLQNGGVNKGGIESTTISKEDIIKIVVNSLGR